MGIPSTFYRLYITWAPLTLGMLVVDVIQGPDRELLQRNYSLCLRAYCLDLSWQGHSHLPQGQGKQLAVWYLC